MPLNCKQGDLALVIGGGVNAGRLVTCLEILPAGSCGVERDVGPLWRVDRPIAYEAAGEQLIEGNVAPDMVLMPIRPAPFDGDAVTQQSAAEC